MASLIDLGESLYAQGKLDEAQEQFQNRLAEEPENADLLNNLGVISFKKKQFAQAATYFSKGLSIASYNLDLVCNYCELLKSLSQLNRALPLLEMVTSRFPDDPNLKILLAEVVSLDTDSIPEKVLSEGRSMIDSGQLSEADAMLGKLIVDHEDNSAVHFQLARSAYKQNEPKKAALFLLLVLACQPNHDEARKLSECVISEASKEKIKENADLIALSLALTFAGNGITQKTTEALKNLKSHLDDHHKNSLIDLLMVAEPEDSERFVIGILTSMESIDNRLAEKLGDWMQSHPLTRDRLDRIEFQICLKCSDNEIVRRIAKREEAHDSNIFVVPGFETYPRRIVEKTDRSDPFMKLVPDGAPSKANGMKILVISDFNIAGQHTRLMRSLNKYTNHAVRCVIYNNDFLSYDKDLIISNGDGQVSDTAMEEAASLIRQADFFHIGRQLCPITGIKWEKYISPRNAVFQYHGSHLRNNGAEIARFHAENKFEAISCVDWSIYRQLQTSFYHLHPCILELDELPDSQPDFSGEIRLVHAPSGENYRRIKRSDIIIETMDRLAGEIDYVQSEIVENVTNRECLNLKSHCHVHIASLLMAFGLNAIESAAMGLIPVTTLDNFSRFIYHDSPVVNATKNDIYDVVKRLVVDRSRMTDLSFSCREWARRLFDAKSVAGQYAYLYDLIYHGLSVDYPNPEKR